MNTHKIKVSSGQIRLIREFFEDYKDDKVTVTVEKLERIDMILNVDTEMSGEEAADYIKQTFKKSPMGPALYFTVKYEG